MDVRLNQNRFTALTAVSNTVKESWCDFGVKPKVTIYNPVSVMGNRVEDSARIRREFSVPEDSALLLNVGRLAKQKAQDVLLDAAKELKCGCDCKFHLVIAGRGPDEEALKAQARKLGLENHVTFAGFRTDVNALLGAADVFVFPSRWEGLPVAGLEAMASGTAVAAAGVDSMKECIADGQTGLLAPVEDAPAFAGILQRLVENPALRKNLARRRKHTFERCARPIA